MIQNPVCPDCSGNHLKLIGKLPESNEFSGNILEISYKRGKFIFMFKLPTQIQVSGFDRRRIQSII
jgi:hypothetical protein